jgi:hypothetical protein
MAKRFTKRHVVNGYAAMGNARRRPKFAQSIASMQSKVRKAR